MRVSRAKATENRVRVIDVASRLFRKHGFDGIGLNDLMHQAGLTQGGFYKQFKSKEDLAVQACGRAMERGLERWSEAVAGESREPLAALIDFYFRTEHRDELEDGCPLAALGADAVRHGVDVKASFEAGIKTHLDVLDGYMPSAADESPQRKSLSVLATMVGTLLLSRAVNDQILSTEFLAAGAAEVQRISTQP